MLGVTVVLGIVSVIAVFWAARVAMGFGRDVRGAIFRSVESFSQVEVNHFGTASLITRNTNDVQQVQMVVLMGLTVMITAPIMMIGGLIMALRQDVPLTGLLLVIVPIMAVIIGAPRPAGHAPLPGDAAARSTGSTRSCARRSPASG